MLGPHYCLRIYYEHTIMSIIQSVFFAICEGILELDLFVFFFFCSGHFIGDFLEGNVEALQFPHATYLHCIMVQVGRVWNHANEQPCFN